MNILLVYFTGTYNTLFLTNILANKLKNNGHYVEVKPIDYKLKFNITYFYLEKKLSHFFFVVKIYFFVVKNKKSYWNS